MILFDGFSFLMIGKNLLLRGTLKQPGFGI